MSGRRGLIAAWCLYDFANSAFATTILAVLFNEYFARVLGGGMEGRLILGRRIPGPTLYTILLSATLVLVAVTAPRVGIGADRSRRPMAWLLALAVPAMAATAGLGFLGPGDLAPAALLFGVALYGFALSSLIYNSLLPRIAGREMIGRVSGWGWGLGYLGGGLVLALNLGLIRGLDVGSWSITVDVPVTFTITAVWWALFTIPLIGAAGRIPPHPRPAAHAGVRRFLRTAARSPNLARFLAANLLYGDGVQTVVAMAAIFGSVELGWAPDRLILYFLAIQGAAFIGSMVLGRWSDRAGDRPVLLACLAVWIAIGVATWRLGWTGRPGAEYWGLGFLGGFILGPTQSLARSYLARETPAAAAGSIFSLFAVSNRFAAILGPLTYGATVWLTGDLRLAVLTTVVFFVAGMALLAGSRPEGLRVELRRVGSG
ncbi:MAG: MFS transporter [Candidatus Eisenbacteria bacterium]|nr:MFS transporter [Candidatus Eisenbacteria bacterium]